MAIPFLEAFKILTFLCLLISLILNMQDHTMKETIIMTRGVMAYMTSLR